MRGLTVISLVSATLLSACGSTGGGVFLGDTSRNDAFELQIPQSTVDLLYGPGASAENSPSLLD